MKPESGETTLSYATRLRLQAQSCEFGDACEERILEHFIQTTDNQTQTEMHQERMVFIKVSGKGKTV